MVNTNLSRVFLNKVKNVQRTFTSLMIIAFSCQLSFNVIAEEEGSWTVVNETSIEQSSR